ncbi:response regulator receiver modulated diguanylate cyclase with PAS/PAC sensor [Trichormus variabilis ATCC 29413]|uniref:Response regulator receiver modulated diguanylate cyclase with PAS/PAC sensor n=2 Tax=Anabaena variabilis TaxID=264691 RepID=Q3M6W1_TRIV2|nr:MULTISPECIES: diguanylate cyclase [Nostocaceae]ABA23275.1 response regulator receiver modulated diguanylate cyclase with PAS/PAC sensor [Trichormus variabilis ATCC 29413]MBC1215593.1 diguanylate cyclase [Trichormus variabilis ARAD]MBC1255440.1 diguanylate cyclase [Trichormus variabilis V5]MBC1267341.1 diguanylate cyclase [Trichormus variabilis FSR]MBC1303936.1 diguanylate cyclase [Trichormus variabilis N2B]
MVSRKILVVEDEAALALNIKNSLQALGYNVLEITNSPQEAIKKVAEKHPDLVLFDIRLSGEINGIQVANIIQDNFHIPVLCIIEYSQHLELHNKQLDESFAYLLKPFAEKDLHLAVEMALKQYQIYERLQEETAKKAAIINSMGCGVIVTFTNGQIQMMNPMAERLTGWMQHEAFGKDLAEVVNLVDKDMDEVIDNLATQAMQTGEIVNLPENCTLISKDGKEIPIGDKIAPIRDNTGNITGAVLVFQDITQRKQSEVQLLRNAFYDGLTTLPNRILFLDRLKQAIERSKRRNDYRFAVLFLDLDGFQGINDRFGHGMGDDFLVAIAHRLESCVRSGDTVGRFGGDEFAVLLEDIRDVNDAINVAKRIQDTLGLPLNLNGHQIFTTASIGITLNAGSYDEPENLLRDADHAMFRAKQQGKARYGVFNKASNC